MGIHHVDDASKSYIESTRHHQKLTYISASSFNSYEDEFISYYENMGFLRAVS